LGDGAGSLYYNHTESIENVASSFHAVGEEELAQKIRQVWRILEPFGDAQNMLVQQCLDGVATSALVELEALINRRWDAFYDKLEHQAGPTVGSRRPASGPNSA